jgi:hypothetical protein
MIPLMQIMKDRHPFLVPTRSYGLLNFMLTMYLSVQEIRQMTLHLGVKHWKVLEVCTTKDVQTSKRWIAWF